MSAYDEDYMDSKYNSFVIAHHESDLFETELETKARWSMKTLFDHGKKQQPKEPNNPHPPTPPPQQGLGVKSTDKVHLKVSFAALSRMRLRKLQAQLVQRAMQMHFMGGNPEEAPKEWEELLAKYGWFA